MYRKSSCHHHRGSIPAMFIAETNSIWLGRLGAYPQLMHMFPPQHARLGLRQTAYIDLEVQREPKATKIDFSRLARHIIIYACMFFWPLPFFAFRL